MPLYKTLCLLLLFALISACTVTKPVQISVDEAQNQQQLAKLKRWQIEGRMAFKSDDEKFSATLNWQQNDTQYDIKLSSFIGTSLLHMYGEPGAVSLETDDKTYHDSDASVLIYSITGWNIPVERLSGWLKGQIELDDKVRLSAAGLPMEFVPDCLNCGDWKIAYKNFKQINSVWLPHQIELSNTFKLNNKIKIRINQWKIN